MRYPKKKTRLLVTVILVVCFSLVAALAMAQGGTPEKPKKTGERGQMCPRRRPRGKGCAPSAVTAQPPRALVRPFASPPVIVRRPNRPNLEKSQRKSKLSAQRRRGQTTGLGVLLP